MPHIDKKSPLTYYLYGLLPDVLSGHDPQKRQLPGNLGFILHATDASLKAGHIIMPAAQTHETPEDVCSGLIMPHSSGAAAGFDFTELGSDAMGGIQNQLKYREVSALPGKIYGVDMNMTRATTIAPENIGGGVLVPKRLAGVRVFLAARNCLMGQFLPTFHTLIHWQI